MIALRRIARLDRGLRYEPLFSKCCAWDNFVGGDRHGRDVMQEAGGGGEEGGGRAVAGGVGVRVV